MPYIAPRPIGEAEYQVLRKALSSARVNECNVASERELRNLTVYSVCKCGCASIGFLPEGASTSPETQPVADALGLSAAKKQVGVLVYGSKHQIVELEVHWPYAEPAPLPIPETIVPWERGEEVRGQEVQRGDA
jgi:hypothetical protein